MSQNSTITSADSMTPCQLKSTYQDCDYVFDNFSSLFSITFSKVATPPSKDPSKSLLFLFESIAVQDLRRQQALKHDHQVKIPLASSSQSSHGNHDIQSSSSSQKQYQIQTQQETSQKHSDEPDDQAKRQQNSQVQQSKKKKRLSIIVGSPSALGNQERTNNYIDCSQLSSSNANNSHILNGPNTHSRSRSNIQFDSQTTHASEKQHTDEFKNQQQAIIQQHMLNNKDGKHLNPIFEQPSSRQQQLQQISSFLKAGAKGNSKRKILKIASKPPQLLDPSSTLHAQIPQFSETESSLPKPNPSSCNNIVLINPNNAQNYFLQNSGKFDKTEEGSKKLQNTQPISKKTFIAVEEFNKTGKITSSKENIPAESRGVAAIEQTKNAPSIFSMTSKTAAAPISQGRSIFPSTATSQENKKPLALASLTSKYQNSSKQNEGQSTSNAIKFSSSTFNYQQDKKLSSNESAPFKRLPSCLTNYTLAEQHLDENTRHDSKTRNSSRDHSINGIKHGKNQQQTSKNPRFHIRNLANPISSVKNGAMPQLLSSNNNNQKKITLGGSKTANSSLNQNELISNIRG